MYGQFLNTSFSRDFSQVEFLRLPVGLVYKLCTLNTTKEKNQANIYSIATARLASIVVSVANGLGGGKSKCEISIDDLLPFPLDEEAYARNSETEHVTKELIRKRRLPLHVIAALSKIMKV